MPPGKLQMLDRVGFTYTERTIQSMWLCASHIQDLHGDHEME